MIKICTFLLYINYTLIFKNSSKVIQSTNLSISQVGRGFGNNLLQFLHFMVEKPWVLKQFPKQVITQRAVLRIEPKIQKLLVSTLYTTPTLQNKTFSREQLFSLRLFALAFLWQFSTISRGLSWALVPTSCPGEVPGCFLIAHWAYIFNGERLFCFFLSL